MVQHKLCRQHFDALDLTLIGGPAGSEKTVFQDFFKQLFCEISRQMATCTYCLRYFDIKSSNQNHCQMSITLISIRNNLQIIFSLDERPVS